MRSLPIVLGALALLAAWGPVSAQREPVRVNASGAVSDLSSGQPVSGALVEFPALRRQSITDSNGRFTVAQIRPGRHKMVVTQLGYQPMVREVQVSEGDFLLVNLEPDPVLLKSLNVQIDRLAHRRQSVSVSVSAFDRRQLLNSASLTAADFVRARLTMLRCPSGRLACVIRRGALLQPTVYIDERRAFGMEELEMYPSYDIYLIETYDSGRMIRVYTNWFVQNLARNKIALQHIIIW